MAGRSDRLAPWRARAPGWTATAPETVSTNDRHNQRLIAAAAITPGMRVLDLATGAGEPAISIALRVGDGGFVAGTDLVVEMMEGARRRAAALGLAQLRFAVADMEALPYAAASFDAATCRFGIMFPADPVAAAAEARRVLRPGARAAFLVHGPAEHNDLFETTRTAIAAFFGAAPDGSAAGRYRFAAEGTLAATMRAAGYRDVTETAFDEVTEVAGGQALWRSQLDRNREPRVVALDAAGRAALEQAVAQAFAGFRTGDAYRLRSFVRMGVGVAT